MKRDERGDHWDEIYGRRPVEQLSWYRPRLELSLEMIRATGVGPEVAVIDVGGGVSPLAGDLLELGFEDVTVLDVSAEALASNRERLGEQAGRIRWIEADVTEAELDARRWDVWHDRAVFHFLIEPGERVAYLENLRRATRPGAHVVLATFASDGPERCSGLPVRRYDADELAAALGPEFETIETRRESHLTPSGTRQAFCWVRFQRGTSRSAG